MKKVLLIEDDIDIAEIMTYVLCEESYDVTSLNHILAFEDMLDKLRPDIVLLDLDIAGLDGRKVCNYIKSNIALYHIPVVLVSASNRIIEAKDDCGADDLITKPFDIQHLINTVAKYTVDYPSIHN
jgi:DNA-binding response OmpR family regulator